MLAVLVCSLFNLATLIGLLAGITVGFVRARGAVAAALAYDPLVEVRSRPAAAGSVAPA